MCIAEATGALGGTCTISWGQMSGAGTRIQAEKGIADSWRDHYEDAVRITGGTAKDEFLRLATRIQGPLIDWLEENGFEMAPEVPGILYAHEPYTAARLYWGNDRGQSICKVLFKLLQPLVDDGSVTVRLNTAMSGILVDDDGGVQGISTESGERILARNTFLTTGGYSGNREFYEEMHPGVTLYPGTWEHARGDGIRAAMAIGAATWNEENFSLGVGGIYDSTTQYPRYCGIGGLTPQVRLPWEILVNQEGRRFMAEDHESYEYRRPACASRPATAPGWSSTRRSASMRPTCSSAGPAKRWRSSTTTDARSRRAQPWMSSAGNCGITDKVRPGRHRQGIQRVLRKRRGRLRPQAFSAKRSVPGRSMRSRLPATRCAAVSASRSIRGFACSTPEDRPIRNLYAAGEILGGGLFGAAAVAGMGITPALAFGRYVGEKLIPLGET